MSRKLYDNTETLEEVLELLNNKAAGGGGTDTSDATATSADILIDKTAYANGEKITGSIPLQSAKTITPSASEQVAISSGYYASGDVKVQGDANLTAENIKKGATIFGVEGNYEGGGGENKLAKVVDGTATELTAQDLAGATSIRSYAFYGYQTLVRVEIPDNVTSIGLYAFYTCYKLTSVVIPNSVTSIGASAFYTCASLTSIIIPDGVTTIGASSFYACEKMTSVVIGNSVTTIGGSAFSYCRSLTSVEIPNLVTKIEGSAFHTCDKLNSVIILGSVTSIGNSTFRNCPSLKRVDFSNNTSIPTLDSYAFAGASADLQIKVPTNLIDSWKAATNWSALADKIVTEFTNTLKGA